MSSMQYIRDVLTSPMFAGGVGAAASAAILYSIRAMPGTLWNALKRQITVELILDNSDDLFDRAAIYLSETDFAQRTRWLRMAELYDSKAGKWTWCVTFGLGWHLLRDHGQWYLLHRALDEKSGGLMLTRRETLTVRTLGRSQQPIRALMKRAEDVYKKVDTIRVYVWHKGGWMLADHKFPRSFDSIYLPADQKQRIINDLINFTHSRPDYQRRSSPYRRGYLLQGPPGTGKTSIAFAMASLIKQPIYMINLNTAGGDNGLLAAFNFAEPGSVIVIEDADTANITHNRNEPEVKLSLKPDEEVSLGGLLNVIDGLASRENRVLILTSNHPDKLDPALLRPGRIDLTETIGLLAAPEAQAMIAGLLGETMVDSDYCREILNQLPMSPADLQGLLVDKMKAT
jgi:chaperone BCS1